MGIAQARTGESRPVPADGGDDVPKSEGPRRRLVAKANATAGEADKALESGAVDNLVKETNTAVAEGIRARFNRVMETKKHAGESVVAGREYVEAYVEYAHYVERLYAGAASPAGHQHEAGAAESHGGAAQHGGTEPHGEETGHR